jgi:hypothetical protein
VHTHCFALGRYDAFHGKLEHVYHNELKFHDTRRINASADVSKLKMLLLSCLNIEFCFSDAMGRGGSLHLPVLSMNRFNQTEPATFYILSFWDFFRDSDFRYFNNVLWVYLLIYTERALVIYNYHINMMLYI